MIACPHACDGVPQSRLPEALGRRFIDVNTCVTAPSPERHPGVDAFLARGAPAGGVVTAT